MLDKSKLGERYVCFTCGTKFYDLNRPAPTCPECGADQVDAPQRDIKSLLGRGRKKRAEKPKPPPEPTPVAKDKDGDDDEEEEEAEEAEEAEESEDGAKEELRFE